MPYRTITLTTSLPIVELRLAAPAGGAIDTAALLDDIDAAAVAIADDPAIRVALLTADSGAFAIPCAPITSGDRRLPFRSLELMPQPVIAAIEGDATGAALELALACDIRIASEDAAFALPVADGAMPSLGGTQRLPRLIGRARAGAMILLGERIDAAMALAYGLINAVTPRGEALAHAEGVAASIAARGPIAVRYAKEAVARGLDMPLDQALRYETDLTIILQTTADRAEGVRAFLEKRAPKFEGR